MRTVPPAIPAGESVISGSLPGQDCDDANCHQHQDHHANHQPPSGIALLFRGVNHGRIWRWFLCIHYRNLFGGGALPGWSAS